MVWTQVWVWVRLWVRDLMVRVAVRVSNRAAVKDRLERTADLLFNLMLIVG